MQITTNQEEQTHDNRRFGAPLSAQDELNVFLEDGTAQLEEKRHSFRPHWCFNASHGPIWSNLA